jgi:hypothetical protein
MGIRFPFYPDAYTNASSPADSGDALESFSLTDTGTETLYAEESDPQFWGNFAETDGFKIQDSISNQLGVWASWSDDFGSAGSVSGTNCDTYAAEYNMDDSGSDSP